MDPTLSITSIGKAAAELQAPVSQIRQIARALSIVPEMVINDIPHFRTDDLERIAAEVRCPQQSPVMDRHPGIH